MQGEALFKASTKKLGKTIRNSNQPGFLHAACQSLLPADNHVVSLKSGKAQLAQATGMVPSSEADATASA